MWSGPLSRYFDFIEIEVCGAPHEFERNPGLQASAPQVVTGGVAHILASEQFILEV